MATTSAPSERKRFGASELAAPFAQSRTIRNPLKSAPASLPARNKSRYSAASPVCSAISTERGAAVTACDSIPLSNSASTASANFLPRGENNFTPLSLKGLCDAEITTPAENPRCRTSHATPGVGITPAEITEHPAASNPRENCSAIHGPDSRVSIPKRTSGPGTSDVGSCARKYSPSARPSFASVSSSSGNNRGTPRMPSVPKSFFVIGPKSIFQSIPQKPTTGAWPLHSPRHSRI